MNKRKPATTFELFAKEFEMSMFWFRTGAGGGKENTGSVAHRTEAIKIKKNNKLFIFKKILKIFQIF